MRADRGTLAWPAVVVLLLLASGGAVQAQGRAEERNLPGILQPGVLTPSIVSPSRQPVRRGERPQGSRTPRVPQSQTRQVDLQLPPLQPHPFSEGFVTTPAVNTIDPYRYRLGPGDVLAVSLYGSIAERLTGSIAPDGTLFVYPAGKLKLGGMTLSRAEGYLQRKLERYYRNFELALQVVDVRRFTVQILGNVEKPGTYEVDGSLGACEALTMAGGLTEEASRRRIQILDTRSPDRPPARVDYLRWVRLGDQAQNPPLQPGQALVVPARERQVLLTGEVHHPGIYEVLPGERIEDLLELAGGFTARAARGEVRVRRWKASGQRSTRRIDLEEEGASGWSFALADGDQVEVLDRTVAQDSIVVIGELVGKDFFPETRNQVTGEVEVQRRGRYRLAEGETARDVVLSLGGPTAKADLRHARVERRGPDGSLMEIPLDLEKLLASNPGEGDVVLQAGDTLVVPAAFDTVFVVGQVEDPGPIEYKPGYGLRDYLAQAGGPTDKAATQHGRVIRKVPGGPPVVYEVDLLEVIQEGSEPDLAIRPGDIIWVPLYKPVYEDILRIASSVFVPFSVLFR